MENDRHDPRNPYPPETESRDELTNGSKTWNIPLEGDHTITIDRSTTLPDPRPQNNPQQDKRKVVIVSETANKKTKVEPKLNHVTRTKPQPSPELELQPQPKPKSK